MRERWFFTVPSLEEQPSGDLTDTALTSGPHVVAGATPVLPAASVATPSRVPAGIMST